MNSLNLNWRCESMKREKKKKYVFILISFIAIAIFLAEKIGVDRIISLDASAHLAIFGAGATLLGFIITDVSVLFACLDNEIIRKLWDNHYLDNTFRFAVSEATSCFIMMASSIMKVVLDEITDVTNAICFAEMISVFCTLLFLMLCICELVFVIKAIKDTSKDEYQLQTQ